MAIRIALLRLGIPVGGKVLLQQRRLFFGAVAVELFGRDDDDGGDFVVGLGRCQPYAATSKR